MSIYIAHLRAFSHDARLFLLAYAVLSIGTAAPQVLAPLYFRTIGFDAGLIGWTSTANQIGGLLGTLPAVFLVDWLGRRRSVLIGGLLSLATWSAAMLTQDRAWVLGWLVLSGMGNVLYGLAVVPMLAQVSKRFERTTLFAAHESISTFGLFLGGLAAGMLPGLAAGALALAPGGSAAYQVVLLGSALWRAIGFVPILLMQDAGGAHGAPAPGGHGSGPSAIPAASPGAPLRLLRYLDPRVLARLQTPVIRAGLPFVIVFFAGSLIFPFLSLYLRDKFAVGDAQAGTIWGVINLSIGVGALLAPLLVQRIGRRALVTLAACVSAICIALMGLAPGLGVVVAAAVLRAGIFNMAIPVYRAMLIDQAPRHEHTIVALLLSTSANLGATAAPPLSGALQDNLGYGPVFALSAGLYALGALAFWWAARANKNGQILQNTDDETGPDMVE